MTEFYTLKDAQADLTIAAINCAVLLAPYSATPALTLESPIDGSLDIPPLYVSMGHLEKKAGVNFVNDIEEKDIDAYGEPEPIRNIISRRKISFDFSMYQNQRNVLETYWAADFSQVQPSQFGGVVMEAPALPGNIFYRAVVIAMDNRDNRPIYPYWLMPKVKLSKVDNQQLNDDGVIEYHPTLTAFKDDVLGYSVAQGFSGPGWRDNVARAGFAPLPSKLTISPTSPSLTVAAGNGHTAQLMVVDANTINYTPDCVYVSSAPSVATVSATGLVTAVSAGSATITATLNPVGGAPALTGTVAVTAA